MPVGDSRDLAHEFGSASESGVSGVTICTATMCDASVGCTDGCAADGLLTVSLLVNSVEEYLSWQSFLGFSSGNYGPMTKCPECNIWSDNHSVVGGTVQPQFNSPINGQYVRYFPKSLALSLIGWGDQDPTA
jgi:hypothetical protein